MEKFNVTLLSDYMGGLWGYGNLKGDYWFVGMEEGGGAQSLLSEHAFAYHSLRLSQAVNLFVEEPIDYMLTSYRFMQSLFLEGSVCF